MIPTSSLPQLHLTQSDKYHVPNAILLACLANDSYMPEERFRAKWGPHYPTAVRFVEQGNAEMYCLCDAENLIFVFRGTQCDESDDIAADLQFFKARSKRKKGNVHSGFKEYLDKLWGTVQALCTELDPDADKQLWFSGHSLGAAMATICASRIVYTKPITYNFGSPRVGDHLFATAFDKSRALYRHVNNNDIIPTVPPSCMGYKHVGTRIFFNSKGRMYYPKQPSCLREFWNGLKSGVVGCCCQCRCASVADHCMTDYVQHLLDHHNVVAKNKKDDEQV